MYDFLLYFYPEFLSTSFIPPLRLNVIVTKIQFKSELTIHQTVYDVYRNMHHMIIYILPFSLYSINI